LAEFLIPLTNQPQEFSISIENRELTIFQRWNEFCNSWMIDISDTISNTPLIAGVPLVAGVDLLEPFPNLGFKGVLIVYTDGDSNAIPTFENLGIGSNLYYVTV